MAAIQSTGLPFVDVDIDQDADLKRAVDELIERELEASGGRDQLLQTYLATIAGKDEGQATDSKEPKPMKAIDLKRYDISVTPTGKDAVPSAEKACVVLEYERMKQSNLLLLAQVGQKAWSAHAQLLEGDAKRTRMEIDAAQRTTDAIDAARASTQTNAAKTLQDLSEKWGRLAFSAAMLRGALTES
jgi:hypothetical protein